MKRQIYKALAAAALFAVPAVASAASSGIATANVNMRSGPSTRYPAVVVIPAGAPITINGCLNTVNWCDVTFARGRGWVSGTYIQAGYRQNRVYVAPNYYRSLGIPTVTFDVDTYWGRYYRDRDFYRQRDRWRSWDYRRDPPPPPPPHWRDRDADRDMNGDWRRDRDRPRYDDRNRDEQGWRGERPDPRFDDRRQPPPPRGDDGYRRPPPPPGEFQPDTDFCRPGYPCPPQRY